MIELRNVTMRFRMANDRITSLKEFVVKKVSKKLKYNEFVALNDVSFSIKKGEVVGIIGNNGAGKSTLLKIISGIMTPTEGKSKVEGSISPLLELGAGFDIDLTAKENIFLNGAVLGYSKKFLESMYNEIVEFSELEEFMEVPVRNFSSGMTARLAFAIATLVKPDILIVDEILSVGDARFQKKSSKRMRELINGGATVLLVSHNIEQIREMCTRVIWLDRGTVRMIGNTDEVCNAYNSYTKDDAEEEKTTIDLLMYKQRLYTPTYIAKYDSLYFIVDCWHHRVIYNDNLIDPIGEWKTFSGNYANPHTISSNGDIFLVEDTQFDKVKVLGKQENNYIELQSIDGIGSQPHKVVYDKKREKFYGISAATQQIFILSKKESQIIVEDVVKLDFLGTAYCRALSLIDDEIYIVSGPGKITVTDPSSFDLLREYTVPYDLIGMNDIAKIGSYYYISSYQNGSGEIKPKLVRVKDLSELCDKYEDIYEVLEIKGVPYYFSIIDDRFFLTEIDSSSAIRSFKVTSNDVIYDIQVHYNFGGPDASSLIRRKMK